MTFEGSGVGEKFSQAANLNGDPVSAFNLVLKQFTQSPTA